jgi:hypothetical protein
MGKPKTFAPEIQIFSDRIEILGEPDGLVALGEMMIMKAKIGKSISITFRDGVNRPIKILSSDDL